jgi:hypothetical protein
MLRHSFGLAWQADTQPIAYFLANSGTTGAVDLNTILGSWTGHEILLVGLAVVNIHRLNGITATEAQLFRCCSVVSADALARKHCSNASDASQPPRLKHVGSGHCAQRKHKKAADFSAACCRWLFSQ